MYEKEIRYSRETRDYDLFIIYPDKSRKLVGCARTYSEGDVTLDNLIYDLLSGQPAAEQKESAA